MKLTETKESPKAPVEAAKPKFEGRPWQLIDDDTPRDNTLLEVKFDPDDDAEPISHVVWRITRRRNAENRRWEVVGFWANALTREELTFEPMVWRLPEGFLYPGMVMR